MGIGRRLTDRVIDRQKFHKAMEGVVGVFSGTRLVGWWHVVWEDSDSVAKMAFEGGVQIEASENGD